MAEWLVYLTCYRWMHGKHEFEPHQGLHCYL